jgi:hypothetical protein
VEVQNNRWFGEKWSTSFPDFVARDKEVACEGPKLSRAPEQIRPILERNRKKQFTQRRCTMTHVLLLVSYELLYGLLAPSRLGRL